VFQRAMAEALYELSDIYFAKKLGEPDYHEFFLMQSMEALKTVAEDKGSKELKKKIETGFEAGELIAAAQEGSRLNAPRVSQVDVFGYHGYLGNVVPPTDPVTALLQSWADGDSSAYDRLFTQVYGELKRIAHNELRKEAHDPLVETTGLVHEVFLRLRKSRIDWEDRPQFYGLFARVMRQILVDFGRKRTANKRRIIEIPVEGRSHLPVDVLDLHEALAELEEFDGEKARLVELRYFAGLSIEEAADMLSVSPATVKRDWQVTRLWLLRRLTQGEA